MFFGANPKMLVHPPREMDDPLVSASTLTGCASDLVQCIQKQQAVLHLPINIAHACFTTINEHFHRGRVLPRKAPGDTTVVGARNGAIITASRVTRPRSPNGAKSRSTGVKQTVPIDWSEGKARGCHTMETKFCGCV